MSLVGNIETVHDFKRLYYRLKSTTNSSFVSVTTRDFGFELLGRNSPFNERISFESFRKGHGVSGCIVVSNNKYCNIFVKDQPVFDSENDVLEELGFSTEDERIFGWIPNFIIRRLFSRIEPRELIPDWPFVEDFVFVISLNVDEEE